MSSNEAFSTRLRWARDHITAVGAPSPKEVARHLGNGISALESVVTSLYLAETHLEKSFAELIESTKRVGGDVDTILAMAGALWGIYHGPQAFPSELVSTVEGTEDLAAFSEQLAEVKITL